MPEPDVREKLEMLCIAVVSGLHLRSHRRKIDTAKDRPLTPHFIVAVPRGTMVNKVRVLTSPRCFRTTEKTYQVPKGPNAVQDLSAVRAYST